MRIDDELDDRVRRAADRESISVSEFIRAAVAQRADHVLGEDPLDGWHDFIGVGRGTGEGVSRRTGGVLTDLFVEKREADRRKNAAERRARGA